MKFNKTVDNLLKEWKGGKYGYPSGALGNAQQAEDEAQAQAARDQSLIDQGTQQAQGSVDQIMAFIESQLEVKNNELNNDREIMRMAQTDPASALQLKQAKMEQFRKELIATYLS